MTTLADKAILSGVDNRPSMLEKDMYDSYKSIMELYMMNRQHGRMILESVKNGPLIWPTIKENRLTRPKKYSELSATETIQADCDVKATNIILQGLPPEKERECKLYDEFDKFAYKKEETLRDFYLRFLLLLNDMNIYNVKLEQFQVNTKFLNTLPPKWSKFVTDVKLVRNLHTTNIDQLHTYLGQHEFHANEVRLMHELHHNVYSPPSFIPQLEYAPTVNQQQQQLEFSQLNLGLTVPVFKQGDDPIDAINHMMSFLSVVVTSRYLTTNNQLRNSSNYRQQAIINDGRVTLQLVHGRQISFARGQVRPTLLGQVEEILGNKGLLFVTTAKGKDTYFEKRFVPQTELSAEQAFWSQNSMNSSDPSPSCRPTKVEVPKELPKVSMVNTSLKKLKHHLAGFDVVVKERTTATAITEGSWGFEHTKACFRDEIIPFVKALKDLFNTFDQYLIDELSEVQNVFHQMEQAVEQHRLESAHSDYLKHTQEEAVILWEIVEQGKLQNPLNNSLDSACKYTKQIQKLLIIIRQTCPSINNSSDKLVAVTLKNKDKRVRFTEPVTSLGNIHPKINLSSNLVSNKPALSSTRVRPSTSASGSQPSGNTKKDKIQRTPSSTQKNKVEAHPRTVESSLKNKNCFVKPKGNANVQHFKLNANSKLLCVKCNGYMLSDNHDLCVLEFINDVNARNKSKSLKKGSKRKVWIPTGKVFTNIGYVR
ncbi:hypothetical protein Tco_0336043 [Tanacetum coccineum]